MRMAPPAVKGARSVVVTWTLCLGTSASRLKHIPKEITASFRNIIHPYISHDRTILSEKSTILRTAIAVNWTQMKSHWKLVLLLASTMHPTMALPAINSGGVVNNASFAGKGMVNSGIAQGSIFAIFGKGLGPVGTPIQVTAFPLQNVLAGTSVTIHAGAATLNAVPLYTSDGQVGAVLPLQHASWRGDGYRDLSGHGEHR